jgi:hypothetical protein
MDAERVRQLVELCLACAARQDEWTERELGPIHVLKYVYLADLAHAERNGGKTFTGAPWRFYHYGPWAAEVYELIEPAASGAGAERKVIPSRYDRDAVRWRLQGDAADDLCNRLGEELPSEVTSAIREAINRFGTATPELLNFVYLTGPMLKAAPGEDLDFTPAPPPERVSAPGHEERSRSAERKRREALKELRARVRDQLQRPGAQRLVPPSPPPRLDELYVQGQEWLDSLAGADVPTSEGELHFDETIWKSRARTEREVP